MSAVLDISRTYRYRLSRSLEQGLGFVTFVMLNPSTADANTDDPTIRKCKAYARDWGFANLVVVNLFGYRTSSPKALIKASMDGIDIIGPENATYLDHAVRAAGLVVCAWGRGGALNLRGLHFRRMLDAELIPATYLKLNKDGSPSHPLYLNGRLVPELLPPVES